MSTKILDPRSLKALQPAFGLRAYVFLWEKLS